MGLNNVVGLFISPSKAWESIASERSGVGQLAIYLVAMAAIPSICGYMGAAVNGWSVAGQVNKLTPDSALRLLLLTALAIVVAVLALGAFASWMAKTYGSSPSFAQSAMMIAYAATPLFLSGFTLICPNLLLNVLALTVGISYATYLLYTGLPKVMNISQERGILFASSILTVGLVVLVAILAATVILWSIGLGPVYTS